MVLSFSNPSGSLPESPVEFTVENGSVGRETEYENDLDDFNGNGYNRFSMISS